MHQGGGRPARRLVVAAALAMGLGGCGIRLEEDAPPVPLVPTRTPIPGEEQLIALLHDTRRLATQVGTARVADAGELAGWHEAQGVVLDAALRRAGVPAREIDPAATAGPSAATRTPGTGTAAPGTAAPGTAAPGAGSSGTAALVLAEQDAIEALAQLIGAAEADLLAMLASLRASRHLVCRVLDPDAPLPTARLAGGGSGGGSRTGSGAAPDRALMVPFLSATREAAYGLEVVAARASGSRRERAIAWLTEIRGLALAQEEAAGAAAPPAPTAYELPLSPDEADSAHRLAQYLLGALPGAYGEAIAAAAAPPGGQRADRVVVAAGSDWLARAAVLAHESGTDPGAFPGLR